MDLLAPNAWPAWVAALVLAIAAAFNIRTSRVPNWLTLGGILAAWAVGALASAGLVSVRGGLASSFVATLVGFGLLFPLLASRALGEGCVKAQMAFGAWLGCAVELWPAALAAAAAVIGGYVALVAFGLVIAGTRPSHGPQQKWVRIDAQMPLFVGSVIGAITALS